jgi:hypothetical protein
MPYIKQEDRDGYDEFLNAHIEDLEENGFPAGDVTYSVYKIVTQWFKNKPKYQTICEIRGMLAGVLSEFDRRFAFHYEDGKIVENGDVSLTLDTQCEHLCSSEAACEACLPYSETVCPTDRAIDEIEDIFAVLFAEDDDQEPCVCNGGTYECGG